MEEREKMREKYRKQVRKEKERRKEKKVQLGQYYCLLCRPCPARQRRKPCKKKCASALKALRA